jgi:hypothetical protein
MKRNFFILLTAIISYSNAFAQTQPIEVFEKAVIIKKDNDSIYCLLQLNQVYEGEVAPLGGATVYYKMDANSKQLFIKTKEVKSVLTLFNTYLSVPVDRSELLFKVAVKGNVSLLEYPKINIKMVSTSVGYYHRFGPKAIRYYAIQTKDTIFVVKQKKDLNVLMEIIINCPDAKKFVDKKPFQLEYLTDIVNQLNNCK